MVETDATTWARGDWMQTFTGRRFYPLDPRGSEIDERDIAHALSLLCRFGGHVDRFYSVAEHCVLMSQAVAPENALAALLHDATEAYVCDVPRPLKRVLAGYREIEDAVEKAIAEHFGLALPLHPEIKEADNRILINEREMFLTKAEHWAVLDSFTPLPVTVTGWLPAEAEERYLARLAELANAAPAPAWPPLDIITCTMSDGTVLVRAYVPRGDGFNLATGLEHYIPQDAVWNRVPA